MTCWALVYDSAGSATKYRVTNELCEERDDHKRREALWDIVLLALPEMKKRLCQLEYQDIDRIHGVTSDCLENTSPLVLDFGLNRFLSDQSGLELLKSRG